jgi:hypothetical protein
MSCLYNSCGIRFYCCVTALHFEFKLDFLDEITKMMVIIDKITITSTKIIKTLTLFIYLKTNYQ